MCVCVCVCVCVYSSAQAEHRTEKSQMRPIVCHSGSLGFTTSAGGSYLKQGSRRGYSRRGGAIHREEGLFTERRGYSRRGGAIHRGGGAIHREEGLFTERRGYSQRGGARG